MRSFSALSYLPLVALSQFLDYDKFNSYADIDFWLRQLGADVVGLTHEGRNLRVYEKTNVSNDKVSKKQKLFNKKTYFYHFILIARDQTTSIFSYYFIDGIASFSLSDDCDSMWCEGKRSNRCRFLHQVDRRAL